MVGRSTLPYFFLPRRARRALLRAVPRLCHAFLRAFILRSFSRRFCLNFGRALSDRLLRCPIAAVYTRPWGL